MTADTVRTVLPARALNGETPTWCPDRRRLFWVDIREPALHAFDPATGRDENWVMPAWIGSYGLTDRSAVVALRTGLFLFSQRAPGYKRKLVTSHALSIGPDPDTCPSSFITIKATQESH